MSAAELINTCPACGAEESLDALLMRMIDDDQARRLIADVIGMSLPVGGLVVRYLRLHKPAKQRLRMARVHALLAELVPDLQRGAIHRKGRDWAAPLEAWRAALASVFEAADKGSITLPLDGNAYLYEVLLRMANQVEAEAERRTEADRRHGPRRSVVAEQGTSSVAAVLARTPQAGGEPPAAPPTAPPVNPGPSRYAQQLKAQIEAIKGQRENTTTTGENDE